MTGKVTEQLVRAEGKSKKPFFIWWAPAAPHREDVATTLMGRPGRDPRPAPRYEAKSSRYKLPKPPSFNEADFADKPSNMRERAPKAMSQAQIDQLQLDYEGRIGSLLAVDDHVKRLIRTLQADRPAAEHADRVRVRQRLAPGRAPRDRRQVPALRGVGAHPADRARPGRARRARRCKGQVANIDFAPTLVDAANANAGRKMDGVSLLPDDPQPAQAARTASSRSRRCERLFEGDIPVNAWDRPYKGVRTDRYTYVVYTETGERELYDRRKDRYQLNNIAGTPAYAQIEAKLAAQLKKLDRCKGRSCLVKP